MPFLVAKKERNKLHAIECLKHTKGSLLGAPPH